MKRFARLVVIVALLAMAAALAAYAQGSNGPGGSSSQFREANKYKFMLVRMAHNIGRLNPEKKAPLTAKQAKAILGVLNPLRKKTTLTEDESKTYIKKLKANLTAKQLTEMGKMKRPERQGGGGQGGPGGPGGQGRPGGQGGPSANGQRPRFDPNAMKTYNPFNPPKDSPMGGRSSQRTADLFKGLEKIAKGK